MDPLKLRGGPEEGSIPELNELNPPAAVEVNPSLLAFFGLVTALALVWFLHTLHGAVKARRRQGGVKSE